jgi:hypothetical protein
MAPGSCPANLTSRREHVEGVGDVVRRRNNRGSRGVVNVVDVRIDIDEVLQPGSSAR